MSDGDLTLYDARYQGTYTYAPTGTVSVHQNAYAQCRKRHQPGHTQSSDQAQVPYACITAVSGTFNSLSKVLCTFPSRYLFAIGLELVLSLRWNVPPNLRCRPRQHDSEYADRTQPPSDVRRDSHPLSCPLPRDLHLRSYWNRD